MGFERGQVVVRRYRRGGRVTFEQPLWVVADDETGLLLWHPVGSEYRRLVGSDGRTLHDDTIDRLPDARLEVTHWTKFDTLVLMPPGAAHSVWWFFRDGEFAGWYVNLEDPYTRHPGAVETVDHLLDVVAEPDRSWRWKDEDELADRTGHPGYVDEAGAKAIRAEGERLVALIEAGVFPFDGRFTDFRPDPAWGRLAVG